MNEQLKDKARRRHLLIRYGITQEQYQELLEKQGGRCAICLRHQDEFKIRLAVDHDHHTLEIRGLCCTVCNHRLIGRHRDPELLYRMAEYVSRKTGWFVPANQPKKRKRIVRHTKK